MFDQQSVNRKVPIIAIEGVDACGKGTQTYRLSQMLVDKHRLSSVVTSVVPDGLGQVSYLRKFLVGGKPVSRIAEALTYMASIYEVCQGLQQEEVDLAITDRSIFSTLAYQVVGRESEKEPFDVATLIDSVVKHRQFLEVVKPDYLIVIDVDYTVQVERMERRGKLDHFEKMPKEFHDRVRNYYRDQASYLGAGVVNGAGTETEITENIYTALRTMARPEHQHFFE